MRVFKDKTGQDWEIAVTVSTLRRVRDNLKVDLLDPMDGKPPLLTQLFLDLILLGDVLYWVCYPQMSALKMDPDSFGDRIDGDTGRRAYEAFFEELMDFFRSRGRPEVVRVIEANLQVIHKGIEAAVSVMDSRMEAEINRVLKTTVDKMESDLAGLAVDGPGTTLTKSPESLESTQPA